MGPGCSAPSPSSKCHARVCEEQADGLNEADVLWKQQLVCKWCGSQPGPQPVDLCHGSLGSFGKLHATTSGSAFSRVQPRVGQDGYPT